MGSEAELEPISTPTLQLFSNPYSISYVQSPERSGMLTPPLQTSASVPFRWEEEPGKPRECTALAIPSDFVPKCLDLPPRLLLDASICKLPSPTSVLESPYMGKPKLQSSSFRIIRKDWYGSFRRSCSPERGQLGAIVVGKKVLGSWRWGRKGFKGKREAGGGSYVFPSSMDRESDCCSNFGEEFNGEKVARIPRTGSFKTLSHARNQFWVTIYEGLKQVVPWRSRKLKKDGVVI